MENQHRKITGYRELSQREIDLINLIKSIGENIDGLGKQVDAHLDAQLRTAKSLGHDGAEFDRIRKAEPVRWLSIAKTDFQTALMALTRAVAQPTTF